MYPMYKDVLHKYIVVCSIGSGLYLMKDSVLAGTSEKGIAKRKKKKRKSIHTARLVNFARDGVYPSW